MMAAELVEAAGIENARQIIADFAAGGFVKSYAGSIESFDARGNATAIRGPTIPTALWRRIILNDLAADVWSRGTVYLAGSDMIGGEPAAIITAITFKQEGIDRLIDHHTHAARSPGSTGALVTAELPAPADVGPAPQEMTSRQQPEPAAIPPGALFASMGQTMRALNKSRGTIYNLIEQGKLIRRNTGLRSVSIEVASIYALAGRTD